MYIIILDNQIGNEGILELCKRFKYIPNISLLNVECIYIII